MSRCSHRKGILLAIEPTDPPGSIALGREGRILEFRSLSPGGQLSEDFLPLLSEMFHEAQLELSDVEGVVLCAGPGSFTGIRVGFSFAYGIAQARAARIYPVPTLDTMAFASPGGYDLIVPALDARKGEVYTAMYRWDGADFGRVSEYISISPENLIYKVISQKCIVFGPGYARYRDIFNRNGVGPYPGEQELNGVLNAETLLRYFFRRDDIAGVDPVDARPIYVRPSEAELKFGRRKL